MFSLSVSINLKVVRNVPLKINIPTLESANISIFQDSQNYAFPSAVTSQGRTKEFLSGF